jgi:hypothetical protein
MFMVVPKQFQSEYGSHIVFLGKEKIEVICMQYFSQWMMQLIKEWLNTSSTLSKVGIHHIRTTFLNATAILCIKSLFVQHLSFNIWRCTVKIFFDKEARVSGADPETLLTGRGGLSYGILIPTHGILDPLPIVFWPPTHGIWNPLPIAFWPPYPWYFDPPTNGILTPYPWYIEPPTRGILTPYLWYWLPYPWYFYPPTHGMQNVYRTTYAWSMYIEPLRTVLWPPIHGIFIPSSTHGILTPYPWYTEFPTHGIFTPLPMVFWPPCPRYIEPPIHGILTPSPTHGILTPYT